MRDPYLLRAPDGKTFYLLATDLSINLTKHNWKRAVQAGSRAIVIWESTNLVQWSEPRLVPVAAEDAGCTWEVARCARTTVQANGIIVYES